MCEHDFLLCLVHFPGLVVVASSFTLSVCWPSARSKPEPFLGQYNIGDLLLVESLKVMEKDHLAIFRRQ
jgi:hypothetical protein